ncbi:nucleotidyltransferase family protein [Micrococcus luteus]|uniref:hypothetical protein n=1 Tax=Micrococcus luteus TaxID=1270 RepID=UPI001642AD6D|nr:hypothetical protein [Micrococcus luteus]
MARMEDESLSGHPPLVDPSPLGAHEEMLGALKEATLIDFATHEQAFNQFITVAQTEVNQSSFYDYLTDLHESLAGQRVAEKIQAIDSWASGESAFRIVPKSWGSVIDKLYRMNVKENPCAQAAGVPSPPVLQTIMDQANRDHPREGAEWITPLNVHNYIDDLLRTKFVLPFADGVVEVSERIRDEAKKQGLPWFWRYHAKDSGYHARHLYVILPIQAIDGDVQVALEIKVLTKLQDTLGELTHLLYELKRTGQISAEKKRKLAWMFESPDFEASYLGHTLHYMESSIVRLRRQLEAASAKSEGV